MSEGVYMTSRETERLKSFLSVRDGHMSKIEAAIKLRISYRQYLRIYAEWEEKGDIALPPKSRGKPSNRQIPKIAKARAIEIMTLPQYEGFGPTYMGEKLLEYHQIDYSKETLRLWMIEEGMWTPKHAKAKSPVHQRRLRRAQFGELLQLDGSPHAWFEDRGEPCTLIIFVDDATGRTSGKFFPRETTLAYLELLYEHVKAHGRPLTLYSDKFSVFRINKPGCLKKDLITQFGRVCKELDVELICANSPQAKGRVERMFQTLQDRLVKELRLHGISNIVDGNIFLENYYWKAHNTKFCVQLSCSSDAHREYNLFQALEDVVCIKEQRKVSKNLEFQYNNEIYQVKSKKPRSLVNTKVNIITRLDESVSVEKDGKFLEYTVLSKQEVVGKEITHKELYHHIENKINKTVDSSHPWKSNKQPSLCL